MAKFKKKVEKVVKKDTKKIAEKKPNDIPTTDLSNEAIDSNIYHPNAVESFKEGTVVRHADKKPEKYDVKNTSGGKPALKKSEKISNDSAKKTKNTGKVTTKKTRKTTGKKVETHTKNSTEIENFVKEANITHTNDQAGNADGVVIDASTENEDFTKISGVIPLLDDQTGSSTEEVVENTDASASAIETEEDVETDGRADSVTREVVEDSDALVSLIGKAENLQTGEHVGSEAEEVIEGSDAIVSFREIEGKAQADGQTNSDADAVDEDPDEIVSFTETEENVLADSQTISSVESAIEDFDAIVSYSEKEEDPQTEKPKDYEPEDVIIGIVKTENDTDNIHDTQTGVQQDDSAIAFENEEEIDNLTENESDIQVAEEVETDIEDPVDEPKMDVSRYEFPARTKKTGNFLTIVLMVAAVVLLLVGSIERRSAKKALVEANNVADVIKQMREESVKEREQIIHSQIEGRELVIDALLLTRNGFELELASTDEEEVKKIIGVFINDIDEREKKIKSEITVLRNKLKMNK